MRPALLCQHGYKSIVIFSYICTDILHATLMADSRLILKNTAVLYIRMGITVFISLYTSRIVLEQLGVEDYGVYVVVAGVVSMLGFLNASLAGATSRFITYEAAGGMTERLLQTFASARLIHYGIAATVFVLAESLGLWFVNTRLVIPPDSLTAANFVYQFTIVSSCLSIIQTPYHAVIISHERFTIYAYIEIFSSLAKLAIAYALVITTSHRLVIYGFLTMCLSVATWLAYRIYSRHNFHESRAKASWHNVIGRPMLSFSAWDLFGNMSLTSAFQGYGIAMNMICGAAINAAYGIANTVQGTMKGLAINVISASRPQVVKSYAAGEIKTMQRLMTNATSLSVIIYLMMAIPLYLDTETVLDLWLVSVPRHSAEFLRIIIISGFFSLFTATLTTAIHATGDVRRISLYPGLVNFAAPFVCYFLLENGVSVDTAFGIIIVCSSTNLCITLCIIKRQIPRFRLLSYLRHSFLPAIPSILVTLAVILPIRLSNPILTLAVHILIGVMLLSGCYLFLFLNSDQRIIVFESVKSRLRHLSRR